MNKNWIDRSVQTVVLVMLLCFSVREAHTTAADVVVYGSTPGGFCAAIAAARDINTKTI